MSSRHVLNPSPATVHWGHFDAKIPARIEVDSGDTVVVDTVSGWGDVMDVALFRPDHLEIVNTMKRYSGRTSSPGRSRCAGRCRAMCWRCASRRSS